MLAKTVLAAHGVDLSKQATKMDLLEFENRLVRGVAVAMGQVAVIASLVKLL